MPRVNDGDQEFARDSFTSCGDFARREFSMKPDSILTLITSCVVYKAQYKAVVVKFIANGNILDRSRSRIYYCIIIVAFSEYTRLCM